MACWFGANGECWAGLALQIGGISTELEATRTGMRISVDLPTYLKHTPNCQLALSCRGVPSVGRIALRLPFQCRRRTLALAIGARWDAVGSAQRIHHSCHTRLTNVKSLRIDR